jgi:hypothetical protein
MLLLFLSLALGVRLSVVDQDRVDIITDHYPTVESVEYLNAARQWVNASDFIDENRVIVLSGLDWVALRAHVTTRDAEGFEQYRGVVVAVAPLAPPPPSTTTVSLVPWSFGFMLALIVGAFVTIGVYERSRKTTDRYESEKDIDRKLAVQGEFYQ